MARQGNRRANVRPSTLKKRQKAEAAKIKKAQTLLKQAYNQIKGIHGHAELDMAKYAIQYGHMQMNQVTLWLDGSSKDPLETVEPIDTELENSIDVEIVENESVKSI